MPGLQIETAVLDSLTADPASPSDGQLWYRSDLDELRLRRNGVTETLAALADADVTGPASSTDNAVTRFDGTTGEVLQNSGVTINDSNQIAAAKTISFDAEYANGSLGATPTINWNNGQKQSGTLSATATVAFTAPPGPCNLVLKVINASPGYTITWPATVKWPGGVKPSLSGQTASEVNVFCFYYDGTNYYGMGALNFS